MSTVVLATSAVLALMVVSALLIKAVLLVWMVASSSGGKSGNMPLGVMSVEVP